MNIAEATYPPLDVPKQVAENIWIVDSGPLVALNLIPLPVRMTVLRLRSGDLLLHSATRFTTGLRRQLDVLGPIRHIVAPNTAHWLFIKDWQRHLPEATTWAAPGLRNRSQVKRSEIRLDHDLDPAVLNGWPDEIDQVHVRGIAGFCEVCLFHRESGTLVLADLVQNFEAEKLPSWLQPFAGLAGVTGAVGRAPIYLRAIVKAKHGARQAAERLLALEPQRVIFAHGSWYAEDATRRLRDSLQWML